MPTCSVAIYQPSFFFSNSHPPLESCLLAPKFSSPATTTLPAIFTLPSIEVRFPEFFFFILPFIRAALPFFSCSPRPARAFSLSLLSPFLSVSPPVSGRPRRFSRFSVRSRFSSPIPPGVFSLSVSRGDGWSTAPPQRPPYDRCRVSIGRHVFFVPFTGDEHYQVCMCTPMSFTGSATAPLYSYTLSLFLSLYL